ncbi:MAG TPA: methyltransferase domain-containing protein [Patescibacteria group bacterium]|nr:methyltransferase domain-containing protein [Patescibacteria group bacterium]
MSRRSTLHTNLPAVFYVLFCGEFIYYTATSCLVIATIPDPHTAAREVRRILKPDGRLRFFEHFRSG